MCSRSSSPGQNRPGDSPRRFLRRPRPRGVAVAVGGAVALAASVAGLAAAGLSSGSAATGAVSSAATAAGGRASAAGTSAAGTRSAEAGARHAAAAARATRPRAEPAGARSPVSARSAAASGARPGKRSASRPKTLRTSCRSVAHIGDSTSVDLISPDYLPNAAQRLGARYAAVGVRRLKIDASGGRSIVEEMAGQVNGYKVASAWRSQGYRGCWVFALGTNDTANVAAGSAIGMTARIDQMMAVAHGEPVLWVNTRTLMSSGPWASANERVWDKTLVTALAKYPNMRIFNWSAVARPRWFLTDGIHYNSFGCAMRAKAIADALARAFPRNGHSAGKIVR